MERMRCLVLALALATLPAGALGQRRPACDPIGYPPDACGRLPDGCGGFLELRPCPPSGPPQVVVRDVGVWTLGAAPSAAPAFATALGGASAHASWLYVYSTAPLDALRVRVRYAGGRAGWAYPAPTRGRAAIEWRGVGDPPADTTWGRLAAGVAMPIGGAFSANGVLLHAGTARFRSPVQIADGGLVSARGEHTVWIVTREAFEERRAFGRQNVLVRTGDHAALRQRLLEELVERGLRDAEANALLDARAATLLSGERSHVIYFLPREEIDRALPLAVTPAPEAVVRVRLVDDYR